MQLPKLHLWRRAISKKNSAVVRENIFTLSRKTRDEDKSCVKNRIAEKRINRISARALFSMQMEFELLHQLPNGNSQTVRRFSIMVRCVSRHRMEFSVIV